MKTNTKKHPSRSTLFSALLFAQVVALTAFFMPFSSASAAEFCNDSYYVDETLPNGARWVM